VQSAIASPPAAKPGSPLWLRLLFALPLLFLASLAAFGFLATFEPNHSWIVWAWRPAYAALGFASLAGTAKLLCKRTGETR
jgi:hypothetical protein